MNANHSLNAGTSAHKAAATAEEAAPSREGGVSRFSGTRSGDLGMLAVAFIWGTANVVVARALEGMTPFWFSAGRLLVAFVSVTALFHGRARALPVRTRFWAVLSGCILGAGYLTGAWALLYTTAGNEAFILSMSVVSVPLAVWGIYGTFPGWRVIFAVALCVTGMAGLMLDETMAANLGDAICLISLLCLTSYIILIGRVAPTADPYGLAPYQALGTTVVSLCAAFAFEPFPGSVPAVSWLGVVYTGTVGFALTLILQNVSQRCTTPTRVAILLSTQGVFGSAAGVLLLGEPMTARIFVSSALILAGVLASALRKPPVGAGA